MDNTQAYQLGHALGAIVVIVALIAFYFLPTIVAFIRRHHYRWPIFVVNLVDSSSTWILTASMRIDSASSSSSSANRARCRSNRSR